MVRDGELMLCDQQSLINGTGTFLSEQSFDAGTVDEMVAAFQARGDVRHDVGDGNPLFLNVQIVEDVDSAGGAATLKVELITADNEELTSNVVSHAITGTALAEAVLVAGKKFPFPVTLPPGLGADQYVGLRFTVGGEAITAGKVDAWLSQKPVARWP
jgi:hypothetical protein